MTLPKHILAPTDFSPNSSHAIQYACDLAKHANSTLHLLHVSNGKADASDREKQLERVGASIDAQSELALTTVKQVLNGNPSTEIANYARDHKIDLVVMGTHGRTGLAHMAIGSVAENVLREAPCPVTVLGPHDGETATMQHAIGVVAEIVGDGLAEDKETGLGTMAKAVMEQLRVASTTAILMVDELENHNWIKWEQGKWITVEGAELVEGRWSFLFRC